MAKKNKTENLVVCCKHLYLANSLGDMMVMHEVDEDTWTCDICKDNEPQTKEAFMEMFVTICKDCLHKTH